MNRLATGLRRPVAQGPQARMRPGPLCLYGEIYQTM